MDFGSVSVGAWWTLAVRFFVALVRWEPLWGAGVWALLTYVGRGSLVEGTVAISGSLSCARTQCHPSLRDGCNEG